MNLLKAISITAVTLLVSACGGSDSKESNPTDAAPAAPTDPADSLAYYYGALQGMTYNLNRPEDDEYQADYEFDNEQFMEGVKAVLERDTTDLSYHVGIENGIRYGLDLNGKNSLGLPADRGLWIENFRRAVLEGPIPEDEVQRAEASNDRLITVANNVILERLREKRRQQMKARRDSLMSDSVTTDRK